MPRSLFFKIFLWFGAVMLTVIVGTFVVGELTRPEPLRPPRESMNQVLKGYAETAAETYERDGQTALVEYIDRIHNQSDLHIFLFNSQAQSLSNHRMPPGAPVLAQRVLENPRAEFVPEGMPPLLAQPIVTSRGERYVLVAEMLVRRRSGLGHFFAGITHLLGVGLVGALFCYWLARYLTSPVAKLSAATRELAHGNLSVRVAPAIGRRRDELASLGADFDLMAEQIEALINSQRRLLGDISHELRSPLARLNVALELAVQRAGPDAASALERIQREAENLNDMIGQLLALTRLESGTEGLRKSELDLKQLIQEIVDDADFEAHSRNRSVRLETIDGCTVNGTEPLLRRAIENVVRNAVQYTAEGTEVEVRLRLDSCGALNTVGKGELRAAKSGRPRRDTPSVQSLDRCAVISVRDHGCGVPESSLPKIFHPFYRVDEARDREAGGVGLGLAIAERAVRLHQGTVTAANASGGGLVVTIILPSAT